MTFRLPTIFVSGLFLFNAVDAHAEKAAQVSPEPAAQPAAPPPAPAPTPTVTPQPAADGPVAGNAAQTDTSARPSLGLAIGLGAGAVAVLGAGIGLGAVAKSRENAENGNVGNPPVYTKSLQDSGNQATNMSYAAYALFAVGGALAIADVVIWIEYARHHHASAEAPKTSQSRVSASPAGLQVSF